MTYIQTAINRVKTIDLAELKRLKQKGHKTVRFRIETLDAAKSKSKKNPASASVPITWMIDAKEEYELDGKKSEAAFNTFISDWISGWA